MGKPYRAKPASYYIRETSPGVWQLAKFEGAGGGDDGSPSQTYEVKGDPLTPKKWSCNCPATWGGKNRPVQECKHGPWIARWIRIQVQNLAGGQPVYYNSLDDRFYPMPGLAESALSISEEG